MIPIYSTTVTVWYTRILFWLLSNTLNWALITQDRWVLQAITGYQLELTQKPHQARQSPVISCSLEEQTEISQEVGELLAKGAKIEVCLTSQSYVSKIFFGGEEKGRAKACYKPQRSQQFCKDGALQGGGPSPNSNGRGTYQFVCLPFGLTSAPRVFTKITKPVVDCWGKWGSAW